MPKRKLTINRFDEVASIGTLSVLKIIASL